MDAYLAVVSKREVRAYDGRPIAADAVRRILEAGRLAGSSRNRQNRRFVVLTDPDLIRRAAEGVFSPANVTGAPLVVVVLVRGKGPVAFDAGRAAQNMMLAAWNEGIGSCPNGIGEGDLLAEAIGYGPDEEAVIVLGFGHPARPRDPEDRSADEWIAAADRRPFDEVVDHLSGS
ncbi:MAG TPA: nitroreductase family protein [Solirubrobacteraceae bacterium]|jgi:nitroreductase|nr:nitroreductase family protein [Solirubrobacteraceae bacterium]